MMRQRHKAHLYLENLESRELPSTYVVAPGGNDGGAGSAQDPWRTLQRAANAVRAGDTVEVRVGTYTGFDLRTSGTAANRIRFSAEAGVLIDTRNARTPDGINLEAASYVTLEGFTVVGMPRAGIRSVLNRGVEVRGNYLYGNNTWGVFSGFSDDILIEYNWTMYSQVEHGIYVSNSGDRPVIRGNYIEGNRGNGIHMNGDLSQGGDGIISNALVEQNIILDNGRGGGSAINCDGVQDSRIINNLVYNTHASGISLYRIDGGAPSRRNLVVNNTVVVAADGRWALNIRDGSTDNQAYNNVFYNYHPTRGSISVWANSLAGFRSDYNAVMNRFTTTDGSSVVSLAQWRTATGQDAHSFVATPAALFVDAPNGDYHLRPGSPAIDAGTWVPDAPWWDQEWTWRPSGANWDVGAYEYAARGAGPAGGDAAALRFLAGLETDAPRASVPEQASEPTGVGAFAVLDEPEQRLTQATEQVPPVVADVERADALPAWLTDGLVQSW